MNLEAAGDIEKRVQSRDLTLEDQAEVAEAVEVLCAYWLGNLTDVAMEGELGAPDWKGFELRTWQLGESLRLFLRKKKRWRGRGPLLDTAASLILNRDLGKGRQTHALLLGDFGETEYGDVLGRARREKRSGATLSKHSRRPAFPGMPPRWLPFKSRRADGSGVLRGSTCRDSGTSSGAPAVTSRAGCPIWRRASCQRAVFI